MSELLVDAEEESTADPSPLGFKASNDRLGGTPVGRDFLNRLNDLASGLRPVLGLSMLGRNQRREPKLLVPVELVSSGV